MLTRLQFYIEQATTLPVFMWRTIFGPDRTLNRELLKGYGSITFARAKEAEFEFEHGGGKERALANLLRAISEHDDAASTKNAAPEGTTSQRPSVAQDESARTATCKTDETAASNVELEANRK